MSLQCALVSTVDSMDESFPSHCVAVFDSKEQAIDFAVDIILEHDEHCFYSVTTGWSIGDTFYESKEAFLEAWQEGLDLTEYFHVKPVIIGTARQG